MNGWMNAYRVKCIGVKEHEEQDQQPWFRANEDGTEGKIAGTREISII